MARTLLYDCFSGISGDMHIGAMVDIGVPVDYLQGELGKLSLKSEFRLDVKPGAKMGITGTKATVVLRDDAPKPHRRLAHIVDIIERAGFDRSVEARAVGIFRALAEAEAMVHGIDVQEVHFHEVGATDAIVDIVSAALGLEYLGVDRVLSRSVEVGGGTTLCEHGRMPVPAPATALLLRGVPCRYGGVDGEATTPTGAAILTSTVDAFDEPRNFVAERIGYGIGHKDFGLPNVLRTLLGTAAATADSTAKTDASTYDVETNVEIACNIDDMRSEAFQPLIDGLFAAGAKDVVVTPVLMKKSRPGHRVSVLAPAQRLEAVVRRLTEDSTTIGVRFHNVQKWMLPRRTETVETTLGKVRIKVVELPNGRKRWKSEHDDVLALARARGESYLMLKDAVDREIAAWMND